MIMMYVEVIAVVMGHYTVVVIVVVMMIIGCAVGSGAILNLIFVPDPSYS